MSNTKNIATLSLLQLLSEGKLDASRGQFYDNQCFVVTEPLKGEMEEGARLFRYPTRLDCFAILLCRKGKFTVTCNLQQMTILPDTVLYAQPGIIVQVTDFHECQTSVVLFSETFLHKINLSLQNLLPHIGTLNQLYTLQLGPKAFDYLWRQVGMVAESISLPQKLSYYHEVVRNSIRALGYSVISRLIQDLEKQNVNRGYTIHNHEEELFRRFIQLVGKYYRTERRINFYAEQMHLTPKYLSAVIRHASGHSPTEWITRSVLLEAKNLLHYSNMSVQEVTFALHFPNQSFFGRWFKTQTGLSPKAYRESK